MKKRLGFTLAEVLITLAIIGVVAAMTIPSVIVNTNQQEFKTGLKKAVSVLNQAITMNVALESQNPSDMASAEELFTYFTKRLNVIKTTDEYSGGGKSNMAFYTSDGMRFEIPKTAVVTHGDSATTFSASACSSTVGVEPKAPCVVIVDVNGDKKPNPVGATTGTDNEYKVPAATDTQRIYDVFPVMITKDGAMPWGVVAQRTMFQND